MVIYQGILRFLRGGTTGAIPYASVVTKLCMAVGVCWPAHEQLQLPSAPIDSSTLHNIVEWYGGKPDPKGLRYSYDHLPGGCLWKQLRREVLSIPVEHLGELSMERRLVRRSNISSRRQQEQRWDLV